MGRIISYKAFTLLSILFLFLALHSFSSLQANEVNAVSLEREADKLERKALEEKDPILQAEWMEIARRKRESARLEREMHYSFPDAFIQDPKVIREMDRTFPKPPNKNLDGVFEVSFGWGSGVFAPTAGGEFLRDPYVAAIAGTDVVPRVSLPYDNVIYFNSFERPIAYAIHPINFKINYYSEDLKYGFGMEERSFFKDVGYNAWLIDQPNRFDNAIHSGEYRWSETKFHAFVREDWSYDKTITMIWGVRIQSSELNESALLPNIPGYFNYSENSFTLGPNIGINYAQNFLGAFVFTVGVEVSAGLGGLEYERLIIRQGGRNFREFFSDVSTEKPIQLMTYGGEFYTKYDFIINESNRFGIKLNYMDFRRQTLNESVPRILTNSVDNYVLELSRYIARNVIYNEESKRSAERRKHIFRWIGLEYTYAF